MVVLMDVQVHAQVQMQLQALVTLMTQPLLHLLLTPQRPAHSTFDLLWCKGGE